MTSARIRAQSADPVGGSRDLPGEIVIESAEHSEFGQSFIIQFHGPERMQHGPGGFGDDGGVPAIGFRLARMQVSGPAHRQSRQVAHGCSGSLSHRDGQRSNGRGLIRPKETSMFSCSRIMATPVYLLRLTVWSGLGGRKSHPRYEVPTVVPLLVIYRPPCRFRWQHPPRIIDDLGENHAGTDRPTHPYPATGTGCEKGNGGYSEVLLKSHSGAKCGLHNSDQGPTPDGQPSDGLPSAKG